MCIYRKKYSEMFTFLIIVSAYSFFTTYIIFKTQLRGYFETCSGCKQNETIVEKYYSKRKDWKTSNLGDILFKNIKPSYFEVPERSEKIYTILIWKFWDRLKNRHLYNFRDKLKTDPLENCAVKNCIFESEDTYLPFADAVVIHLQSGLFPNVIERNVSQRWIFLNDESPWNVFSWAKKSPELQDISNLFNWSMTYRTNADIPVPYGRTVPLKHPILTNLNLYSEDYLLNILVPYIKFKRKDVLASILISNCSPNERMKFLETLENEVPFDIFGRCAKTKANKKRCPGHFKKGCNVTSEYLFYLVLENSQCREYLSEKVFYNAYSKGAIPVIYGPPLEDCKALLPPNSFIHIDQFKSARDLASHMQKVSRNSTLLLSYHKWRNDFEVLNEHGYFGEPSVHYCRVCEALNYNDDGVSIYNETRLRYFLDPKINCIKR